MNFFTNILLLIVFSRVLGEIALRLYQPAIIGEILAGVLLGPAIFGIVEPTKELSGVAELSVFLIVLSAGLNMEFKVVLLTFKKLGFVPALLGFIIPLIGGLILGLLFWNNATKALFLGLCLSITALPVTIRILEKFNLLGTNIGRFSIATAIINDILALLFLGVILEITNIPSTGVDAFMALGKSILKTSTKLLIFAFIVFLASRALIWGGSKTKFIEKSLNKIINFFGKEALFGIAILFVLLFGSLSETLGSHHVIGTFFAGLLLSRDVFGSPLFSDLENTIHSISDGFLAPIFFAYLGLHFSLHAFLSPFFVITLLMIAIGSKMIAGWYGAKWIKLSYTDALGIAIIINAKGTMDLVVANIALQRNFIDIDTFSALVFMGVFTTIITPILFRLYVIPKLRAAK